MSIFRVARPGEFTFKRDSAGVETVEHQGLIFATMRGPNRLEHIDVAVKSPPRIQAAIEEAERAGFWVSGRPSSTMSPVSVTVQV